MTTGAWLSGIARHLLRAEAYEAVVMPAIADLQYEAAKGTWSRWRASAGAARAIAVAVVLEIADDCRIAVQSFRVGSLVGPPLATFAAVTAIYVTPMLWVWRTSPAPWHHEVILVGLLVLPVVSAIAPVTALPAAAVLAKAGHPGSTRAALLLTVSTVIGLVLVSHSVERNSGDLRRELFLASGMSRRNPEHRDRPLWELRSMFRPELDRFAAQERAARQAADQRRGPGLRERMARADRQRLAAPALAVLSYAMFGIAWSARRRWTLVAVAVGVFLAAMLLRGGLQRIYVQRIYGPGALTWTPLAVLFLTACLALSRSRRVGERRRAD
jgi:hypothetical protein